jgi:DNA-binding response OmpR family regulator
MNMNKPTIVIADDDVNLIHALTIRCTALGLQVHTAHDASSAWQQIEKIEPEVVILDVGMPAGNGLCVSEMMSHHERLKHTPVIMLTGHSDSDTIRRCHEMMAYYVTKCDNVWTRIKPLLCEILERDALTLSEEPPKSQIPQEKCETAGVSVLMDAVFAAMGAGAEEVEEFSATEEPEQTHTPWILSIDDDHELANGIRLRLKEHGVEVIRAAEGMEGYRRAFTSPADLILLDYEMPNGNGDYVLGRLKDNPVTKDIPVIVLTGRREKTIERKMYALGADCYMTKPYNWSMLWQEISKYLPEPAHMVG